MGQDTAQSSIVLACEQPMTGYHETNFSLAYSSHISWQRPMPAAPEGDGVGGLFRGIGVGADRQAGGLVAPLHQLQEVLTGPAFLDIQGLGDEHLDDFRGGGLDFAGIDFAGGAVNGEEIPFLEGLAADGEGFLSRSPPARRWRRRRKPCPSGGRPARRGN